MYLHGTFLTRKGEPVTVEIVTRHDRSLSLAIGEGSGVVFQADPVVLTNETDDPFAHMRHTSASIRLLTRGYIPDLYCASPLDATVNISQGGKCVFAGFVVPQTYSQPFANVYDELEINCIDALSALQYYKYRDIGTTGVDYASVRASASVRSFKDLLEDALEDVFRDLDLSGENEPRLLFDGSVVVPAVEQPVFRALGMSELLMLGSTEDEVWSKYALVEEMMRYLNLRMIQQGMDVKIFSADSVKADTPAMEWQDLAGNAVETELRGTVTIKPETAVSTDATMSIGEVYNRIELKCEVVEMTNLVESPLDDESMKSPYTNKQLYLTEYSLEGLGTNDAKVVVPLFKDLVDNGKMPAELKGGITDWYMQVYDSMNWRFAGHKPDGTRISDIVKLYCRDNAHQEALPNQLRKGAGAALVAFGKVERNANLQDNSLTGKVNMSTALCVSVNGNGKDTQSEAYPTDASLLAAAPLAEYAGQVSGGVFSPSDNETVNYIVISGTVALNPLHRQIFTEAQAPWIAGSWPVIQDNPGNPNLGTAFNVPAKDYPDGRLYCAKWYGADYPGAQEYVVQGPGLLPFTGELEEQYEFKYSSVGESVDTISKVGVLACMLIIGDKCVVETGTDGQPGDFEWRAYKERSECASDDEYYQQSFTLGFDPAIGDKLIGKEYPIQNNIDYRMGLDVEGTAIPIRKSDRVSGQVRFIILGAVNAMWSDVRLVRHKTWFRSAKWSSGVVPLMAHVSSIFIKDFEVKVYSDNGLVNNTDDCDLVYMSDTDERFVNVKDDLTFRFTTALTKEERLQLGISDSLKLSSPVLTATGEALLTVGNTVTGEEGKPEQLYIDSCYREHHKPRVGLVHKLKADAAGSVFDRYLHPALPELTFRTLGMSRSLDEGWSEVTLKEIDHD